MKLSQLRNFIAVVEAGTVRQASRNLNLSQSSISKSLQQLEAELGTEMLHRSMRGVAPTPAGKALLSRAKAIEADFATRATMCKRSAVRRWAKFA